jgi:7-carboxy-7-deazaguanine synthase
MRDPEKILVHEIFSSIQGESTFNGVPCIFVRTTVCHLRCNYCDTAHAFHDGKEMSVDEIVADVVARQIPLVEITGGEPLLQPRTLDLMTRLCDLGLTVLLETSGAVSIKNVDRRVHVILDVKTPGSGEAQRNVDSNLDILWPNCEVKFVICDEADYEFAKAKVAQHELNDKCTVLFSPEAESMNATQLAEWIIRDKLTCRFQIQLHKVLWGDKTGV